MRFVMICLMMLAGHVSAHEWTPTYPKLTVSHEPTIYQVTMKLFNKREDISYYTFEVLDDDFEQLKFATARRVVFLPYLEKKQIKIFVQAADKNKVRYICSRTKLIKEGSTASLVSSKICSKIK